MFIKIFPVYGKGKELKSEKKNFLIVIFVCTPELKNLNWFTEVILTQVKPIPEENPIWCYILFFFFFFKKREISFCFTGCGRLLYIGQNRWTHVNCALWSAEVFEDDDGSLKCAYGCDQGQAAGKNLWVNVMEKTPFQFPDVLSEAQCCLTDVSLGSFRMDSSSKYWCAL